MIYSLGIAGAMFLLTIPSIFLFGPWAAIIGVASVVVFILSLFIPHRTQEGEMLAQQWKALALVHESIVVLTLLRWAITL